MAFLLDTNVLSELRKGSKADPRVLKWSRTHAKQRHCVSAVSIGEIRKGIELLRKKSPGQCPAFERWLARIKSDFASEILDITDEVAEQWGVLMAERFRPVVDCYLAATALVHGLKLVTRNTADFEGTGVGLVNPWM
jgi:predicted nucleic acid-binding protein